jgi:hypothetical protein
MRMIDTALVLHLDKDQVRELGLDDALEVGDKCEVKGVAEVTKGPARRPGAQGYGPGTLELKITKISVGAAEHEEPMADYAKRRNAELREG